MFKQKINNTDCKLPKIQYGDDSVYMIPSLMEEKKRINDFKSIIDTLNYTKYGQVSYRSEVVSKEFKQQLQNKLPRGPLTITWAKLYEIYSTFPEIFAHDSIEYFDLCAAPGIFIIQTQFYADKIMNKKINWHATTLNPFAGKVGSGVDGDGGDNTDNGGDSGGDSGDSGNDNTDNGADNGVISTQDTTVIEPEALFRTRLADDYGLIKRNSDRWIFGPKNTGDITDAENVRSFADDLSDTGINIITSDCGVGQGRLPIHYTEQEGYNINVSFGATTTALATLSKGGSYIMKTFTLFESSTVSLMYLLSCLFEQMWITKPMTSKSDNQELYIVCIGYKGIPPDTLADLYYVMDNFDPYRALFADIPDDFITQIAEFMRAYDDRVMKAVNRIVQYYHRFDARNIIAEKAKFEKEWFDNYTLPPK